MFCLKCGEYFAVFSKKYEKSVIFWHFNDYNHFNNILITGSKHETKKMDLFFSSIFQALSVAIFHFCISKPSKFSKVFQIAVRTGTGGKLPPPQWEEIWDFTEGNFFTRWMEPEKEWFWQFKPFLKLKIAFREYWTLIKIKIDVSVQRVWN